MERIHNKIIIIKLFLVKQYSKQYKNSDDTAVVNVIHTYKCTKKIKLIILKRIYKRFYVYLIN